MNTQTPATSPQFDTTFASLPERFYSYAQPISVANATPITHNQELAQELGIDLQWLTSDEALQVLAGNQTAMGSAPMHKPMQATNLAHLTPP